MNSGNQSTLISFFQMVAPNYTLANIFWLISTKLHTLELLLAFSIFVTISSLRRGRRHGLPRWPVVGMFPSLLLGLRLGLYEWITGVLDRQGGTFTFHGFYPNKPYVVTADPRNVEHLLKAKFGNFPKGRYFRRMMRDLLGEGIFNADGEVWQRQRKTASIEFHSSEFRAMTARSLVELVHSRLLPVLTAAYDRREPIDIQDVLLRLTFDNVCMIALGVDPGCLRPGLPEILFAKAFESATEATVKRFVTPVTVWKLLRYLNIGAERELKMSLKLVDKFAYNVVRTRKEELAVESTEKGSRAAVTRPDLLTVFMKLGDENGKEFSEKFLRDICVNLILAGRDTSSVALAWFFWLLNEHPEVEDRIVEELRKIVEQRRGEDLERNGDRDELVFLPEEVKKMEYMQAALSEALRLYPSVPMDLKEVEEDDVLPDGSLLKKGMRVVYAVFSMGRMESIWGKDCREYKPERWLKDGAFVGESAYKFTAFNGGPRLCLGKDFAQYQMKFVAASVLYRYHVEVVENHPVVPKLALTMYMKHGLMVMLRSRDTTKIGKKQEIPN